MHDLDVYVLHAVSLLNRGAIIDGLSPFRVKPA